MAAKVTQLQQAEIPHEGYVRLPQVLAVFPVSRSSWLAGVRSGRYPKSVHIGPRTTAWKASDIRKLLDQPVLALPRIEVK